MRYSAKSVDELGKRFGCSDMAMHFNGTRMFLKEKAKQSMQKLGGVISNQLIKAKAKNAKPSSPVSFA